MGVPQSHDRLLADIGGTHARLAHVRSGVFLDPCKVRVADYESLTDLIDDYRNKTKAETRCLHLATAASWPDADGIYRLANKSLWAIDPNSLAQAGLELLAVENDFEASVRALRALEPTQALTLVEGVADPHASFVMIGPGTGLGLGYLRPDGVVQKTVGGHMPLVAVTPDQKIWQSRIHDLYGRTPIYECILSGWGLTQLMQASGLPADDLFTQPDHVRLFNEYLGLFAQQAVLFGDGFAGIYVHGGLFDRFYERGLFDPVIFTSFYVGDPVPVVADKLRRVPVYYVPDPFLTLKGLMVPAS